MKTKIKQAVEWLKVTLNRVIKLYFYITILGVGIFAGLCHYGVIDFAEAKSITELQTGRLEKLEKEYPVINDTNFICFDKIEKEEK